MSRRVAVLAGRGRLVAEVLRAAHAHGDEVLAVRLDPTAETAGMPAETAGLDNLPALFAAIRNFGATHLVLAGAIDLPGETREALSAALGTGAETGDVPLSNLAPRLSALTGAALLAIPDIVPALAAGAGLLAGPAPTAADEASLKAALVAARGVGALDLGQSVVLMGLRAVAAEDVAGTDALLQSMVALRALGRISGRLTLGKAMKPQQPRLVDLPVIGPETIAGARRAGVALIALDARNTLIVERTTTLAAATAAGITVWGGDV